MPTLESRIAALEQSSGTKDSENQPGEVFARIQNAGIACPAPIRGESTAAWLRRFSDAQLAEVQTWLKAEVAHGATTI